MEEHRRKHGIDFKVGIVGAIALIAAIALVALFSGLLGSLLGSAGPSSGGSVIPIGGSVVIPSDKDGGIVYGDGFVVETVTPYHPSYISDIKIVKEEEVGDGRVDFIVKYKADCSPEAVRIVYERNIEDFRDFYNYPYSCGNQFSLYPGETKYVRILAGLQQGVSGPPIYKVTCLK